MRIDIRWSSGDPARLRKNAADLIALDPDVILAGSGPTLAALLQVTRTVPIVFAQGLDPVGSGSIRSLAQPGGNVTGFHQFEYRSERKMARAAQGGRAAGLASGRIPRFRHHRLGLANGLSSRPSRAQTGWS